MNEHESNLRNDLCEVARRLYNAGFMPGSDGNLSTILSDDEILITPSRLCKGFLKPSQIVKIDRQGNRLAGDYPPTVEVAMHLAAYEERPDVCSVAHCHPPVLVAFTVAGVDLPSRILPEIELMFGGALPLAPYATPGSPGLADSIRKNIRNRENSAVLLDHHGILAVGQDIYQAAIKIEHAEAAAKIIYYARQLGHEKPLNEESLAKLRETRKRIIELESSVYSGYCHAPECQKPPPSATQEHVPTTPARGDPTAPARRLSQAELEDVVRAVMKKVLRES